MELPKHTSINVNNGVLNIIIDDSVIKESYSTKHARIFLSDSNGNAITDKETIYSISNTLYNELFLNKNNIDIVPRRMLLKSTSVDKTCLYKCVRRRIDIILSLNRHVIGTLSDDSFVNAVFETIAKEPSDSVPIT
jgi:small nuclear ribonucleoprotein (snRNP)-like protein